MSELMQATPELWDKAERFGWLVVADDNGVEYWGKPFGQNIKAGTVTVFQDNVVSLNHVTFPIAKARVCFEPEPDKPAPWDDGYIAQIRNIFNPLLETGDKKAYDDNMRMLRNKWSAQHYYPYQLPVACQFDLSALGDVQGLAPATIHDNHSFGGYWIEYQRPDGQKVRQVGVPRWALVIEGEQNWKDVTG